MCLALGKKLLLTFILVTLPHLMKEIFISDQSQHVVQFWCACHLFTNLMTKTIGQMCTPRPLLCETYAFLHSILINVGPSQRTVVASEDRGSAMGKLALSSHSTRPLRESVGERADVHGFFITPPHTSWDFGHHSSTTQQPPLPLDPSAIILHFVDQPIPQVWDRSGHPVLRCSGVEAM